MTAPDRKPAAGNNPPDDGGPLKSAFGALAAMELGFFVLVWIGFGVFAFCQIYAWGVEYDRKVAAVGAAKSAPKRSMSCASTGPPKGPMGTGKSCWARGTRSSTRGRSIRPTEFTSAAKSWPIGLASGT